MANQYPPSPPYPTGPSPPYPTGLSPPYPTGPGFQQQQLSPQRQQQPQQQPAVVSAGVITAKVVMQQENFGPKPQTAYCQNCRKNVVTSVRHEVSTLAWILCAVMFVVGFWLCSLIPFCLDNCQDSLHSCPDCHKFLGQYKR